MEREICFFLDLETFKSVGYFAYEGKSTDIRYSDDYEKIVLEGADCSLITDVGDIIPECTNVGFEVKIDGLLDRTEKFSSIVIPYDGNSDPQKLIDEEIDNLLEAIRKYRENEMKKLQLGLAMKFFGGEYDIPSGGYGFGKKHYGVSFSVFIYEKFYLLTIGRKYIYIVSLNINQNEWKS